MSNSSILYIDDEGENLILLKYLFMDEFLIRTATNYHDALKALESFSDIKIIMSDYKMPGRTGVDILEEFYEKYPDKLRILITAYSDISVITDAVNRAKIYHYISKPIDENNFKIVIRNAINLVNERENRLMLVSQLANSAARFAAITENSHDLIFQFGVDETILYVNPMAEKVIGKKASFVNGKRADELGLSDEFSRFTTDFLREVFEVKSVRRKEFKINNEHWDIIMIPELSLDNQLMSVFVFTRNVTDVKKDELENELKEKMILRAQRLTALGTLSSAIAHEIKQPLQLIKVITDTIILRLNKLDRPTDIDQKNIENLKELSGGIVRINDIINSMKKIISSNKNDLEVNKTHIVPVIDSVINIYDQKLKNHCIELEKRIAVIDAVVNCSETLIHQLIGNIINNAIDALNDSDSDIKKIRFETGLLEGKFFVDISDSGPGIKPEIIDSVFNPMFTTKLRGDSIGMGLYIVQTILNSINGSVVVSKSDLGGASFKIMMPIEL